MTPKREDENGTPVTNNKSAIGKGMETGEAKESREKDDTIDESETRNPVQTARKVTV